MSESSHPERRSDLAHVDDDDEPIRLLDVVRAVRRRSRQSPMWAPVELALQIHRAFNKHLLLAQREMFELEIKYVDRLLAADAEAERREREADSNPPRKKLTVDG